MPYSILKIPNFGDNSVRGWRAARGFPEMEKTVAIYTEDYHNPTRINAFISEVAYLVKECGVENVFIVDMNGKLHQ